MVPLLPCVIVSGSTYRLCHVHTTDLLTRYLLGTYLVLTVLYPLVGLDSSQCRKEHFYVRRGINIRGFSYKVQLTLASYKNLDKEEISLNLS